MNEDYKMPVAIRFLWERRNALFAEFKKAEWRIQKHGESEFINDMTVSIMQSEIRQCEMAISLLEKANIYSIAKYHAIGLAGLHQHNGVRLTGDELRGYYESALKDITEENSIEKSSIEYDKVMKQYKERRGN
jgi:hypothetical protein